MFDRDNLKACGLLDRDMETVEDKLRCDLLWEHSIKQENANEDIRTECDNVPEVE